MSAPAADTISACKQILSDLVAFPTVTGTSTVPIAGYVFEYLRRYGIVAHLDLATDGQRANLFATVGPEIDGGVVLSGHFDVVPAAPAGWTSDPFRLTETRWPPARPRRGGHEGFSRHRAGSDSGLRLTREQAAASAAPRLHVR